MGLHMIYFLGSDRAERTVPERSVLRELPSNNVLGNTSKRMYAFLAGQRNKWKVPPIRHQNGFPSTTSAATNARAGALGSWHTTGKCWVHVGDLLGFDYDQTFEDLSDPLEKGKFSEKKGLKTGEGVLVSYRDFLGPQYFEALGNLRASGATHLLMMFSPTATKGFS